MTVSDGLAGPSRNEPLEKEQLQKLIERFSLHDKDSQRYRHEIYTEMRNSCPVAHSTEHGGYHAVARYKDVYEVAHKPELFSSFPVTIPPFGNPTPMIPIEADPPMHRTYRTLVGRQFSPKSVEQIEPYIELISSNFT